MTFSRKKLCGRKQKPQRLRDFAYQIEMEMKKAKLTKSAMAEKMHTSRSALDRLLDPTNVSITLQTLESAALALGKNLKVELA